MIFGRNAVFHTFDVLGDCCPVPSQFFGDLIYRLISLIEEITNFVGIDFINNLTNLRLVEEFCNLFGIQRITNFVGIDFLHHSANLRLGELIQQEQEAGRLADKGQPKKCSTDGTLFLKDYGLTRQDSSRAQRVAEHQDLIPVVVAKAIEAADTPTRKDGVIVALGSRRYHRCHRN